MVSRHTSESHFSYAHKQNADFPAQIFMRNRKLFNSSIIWDKSGKQIREIETEIIYAPQQSMAAIAQIFTKLAQRISPKISQ